MVEDIKEPLENNKISENNKPDDLAELLRANLKRSEEILKISREIKIFIRWQQVWGFLRLLIIIIPIVLGFIYLPPLIKEAMQSYKSLFIFN